jgi:NAD(P)H-dependent FMN reductase
VLQTAAALAPEGVDCRIYHGLASLPPFNPDDDTDPLPMEVARLRSAIHDADALVFSVPEYAGALPGSLKNLLDWTIGDDKEGSIYDKPVCWLNASPRGANGAHNELRIVLNYAHARIIEAACAYVPVSATVIDSDGLVQDEQVRLTTESAFAALLHAVYVR